MIFSNAHSILSKFILTLLILLNSAGSEECEMLIDTGIVKNICSFFLHPMPQQLIRPYTPPEEVKYEYIVVTLSIVIYI